MTVSRQPFGCSTFASDVKNIQNANKIRVLSFRLIDQIHLYVNKGSDMAVLVLEPETSDRNAVRVTDEIAQHQAGRYISSNEAAWRIF